MPSPRFGLLSPSKLLASIQWISAIKADFTQIEAVGALEADRVTVANGLAAHIASNPATHAAGSVTDAVLGNRTIVQATAAADTANLAPLLSGLANRLKAITGLADWKTAPDTTLAAASAHYTASGSHGRYFGNGNPEGVVTAPVGSSYFRQDASVSSDVLWVKLSGAGNTGWKKVGMLPSVQRGTLVIPFDQLTATATIAAVDTTKAELRLLGLYGAVNEGEWPAKSVFLVSIDLTNSTTITARRSSTTDNGSGENISVSWELTTWA